MSEIYDTEELSEGTFPLSFKLIYSYQREDPILTKKLKSAEYIKGYFRGGLNTINFVTFNDKIVIPQLLQKYVVILFYFLIVNKPLSIFHHYTISPSTISDRNPLCRANFDLLLFCLSEGFFSFLLSTRLII